MATGQNINMRVPDETLDAIDHNAKQAGLNRTQYILSWLPETYEQAASKAENAADSTTQGRR